MGSIFARLRLPSKLGKLGGQLLGLLVIGQAVIVTQSPPAESLGVVCPHAIKPPHTHLMTAKTKRSAKNYTEIHLRQTSALGSPRSRSRRALASGKQKGKKSKVATTAIYYPQEYAGSLKATTVVPGVVYKHYKGPLTINVLDIDTAHSGIKIRPILASETFESLQNISQHAKSSHALAAINANYFKKNGTPLGTLILDGEWIAGPLYDRVSLGVARSGKVRVDRVNLAGVLETNNPACPNIWVNNINQPRRTGSRLVVYTRRWGTFVRLPYEGNLLAVTAQGEIIGKSAVSISIPWGGYVISDSKDGATAKLGLKDRVTLSWRTAPSSWSDVEEAVSGGPLLIKDGKVFVDLKDEAFRAGWTSCHIKARTAAGVTKDHHLLLVTVEGSHTLWDLAKFLHGLGAVDALNLDGGGSTAMFVNGETVTQSKRKVASAIGVFSDGTETARRTNISREPKGSEIVEPSTPTVPVPAAPVEAESQTTQPAVIQKSELHPPVLQAAPSSAPRKVEADNHNLDATSASAQIQEIGTGRREPALGSGLSSAGTRAEKSVEEKTIAVTNQPIAPLPGK